MDEIVLNGKVNSEGNVVRYYLNNTLHRIDGPAVIYPHGESKWFFFGLLHNLEAPAVITKNKNEYYILGTNITEEEFKFITEDIKTKPKFQLGKNKKIVISTQKNDEMLEIIITTKKGELKCTYKDNKLHSFNDQPAVMFFKRNSGNKFLNPHCIWYEEGKIGRSNNYSMTFFNDKIWLKDGELHNLDGPAILKTTNIKNEWWIDGVMYSEEEFKIISSKILLNQELPYSISKKKFKV